MSFNACSFQNKTWMERTGLRELLAGGERGAMPGQRRVNLVALGSVPAAWDGADPPAAGGGDTRQGVANKTLVQVMLGMAQCHPEAPEQDRGAQPGGPSAAPRRAAAWEPGTALA